MINLHPELLDPEDAPLCPLCDHLIMVHEEAAVACVVDVKCLAHQHCITEALEDADE